MMYFRETLQNLQDAADINIPVKQENGTGQSHTGSIDPSAVAAALAEALKRNDAVAQAIAVRIANLQARYGGRAF